MQPTVLLPFQPLHHLQLDLATAKKNDDASIGRGFNFVVGAGIAGHPHAPFLVPDATGQHTSEGATVEERQHFLSRFPFSTKGLLQTESNAASAAFVAVSAIALDALSCTPPTVVKDVPSALRCTAMVLLACVGSPIIQFVPNPHRYYIELEQRTLLLVALGLVATFGEHSAGAFVRVVDSIFSLLSGWVTIGISLYRANNAVPGSALCGGLFWYCGVRIIRSGLAHASEVVRFSVNGDSFDTLGYAVGDATVSTALAFGGTIIACAGVLVVANNHQLDEHGTSSIAPTIGMLASIAFAAAFVCQLAVYARLEDLSQLFGPEACNGNEHACAAAFRARRFHVSNTCPATLWASVVALSVFALPKKRKCPSRDDYYLITKLSTTSGVVTAVVSASCVVAVFVFATSNMALVSVELLLLYTAIPCAWFISVPVGCALSIAGQTTYIAEKADGLFSYNFDYYTNWALAATALLTAFLLCTTLVSRGLWGCNERYWLGCEHISGVLIITILSLQTALTLATLGLVVAYDGTATTTEETSWRQAGFEFSIAHSLSFFFIAAVYGVRFETGTPYPLAPWTVSTRARRWAWYATPPVLAVGWAVRLFIVGLGSPYGTFTSSSGLAVGIVAAVVPWMVCGFNI